MKRTIFILLCGLAAVSQAAWYWPFQSGEDDTNRPPRLHRLLEQANEYIELAEDESAKGEDEKALDYYRQAIDELGRVQRENPDRAEKPEFAPLRSKLATCRAAIDTIRFEQVNANVRAVAVTDTAELQRKWNRKHGIRDIEDEKRKEVKKTAAAKALSDETKARLKAAAALLREGKAKEAEKDLNELVEKNAGDLNVLLLRSAALAMQGRFYAARKDLNAAVKAHPDSPLPHYNLAYVALQLGEGRKVAQEHYDRGRELGGAANKDLEARLKE